MKHADKIRHFKEPASPDSGKSAVPVADYRLLFEFVPDPCLVLDTKLTIVEVNDAYLRATMTKRHEMIDRGLFEVFPDNPAEPNATGVRNLSASLERVLREKVADTMAVQKYDIRRQEEDGGGYVERYWSPINTPVIGTDKEVAYIIHRVQDVTKYVHSKQKSIERLKADEEPSEHCVNDEAEIYSKTIELAVANLEIKRLNSALAKHFTELEQRVAERTTELRENDERFRALVTASSNVVYRMSPDWSEMRQLRGQNFIADTEKPNRNWLQEYIHPDDQPLVMAVINEAIRTKSIFELEHRVLQVDGNLGWTFSRAIPLLDAKGDIYEWFGAASDITERKQAEDVLKKMNEELERLVAERTAALKALNADLERSNKDLELFASVASHDLQEPLRTITSYVELLAYKYGDKLDQQADKYITYIVNGTSHLQTLINDLLDFSRVGTRAKPFAPVKMDAVLDQVLSSIKRIVTENNTTIERDELPELQGDDMQLTLLLQNLISNAIKFRKKEIASRIRVTIKEEGDEWVFGVHDNGIGIDPKYFERIFQIFRRLHTREEYEGSGMGLAISRRIVEHHGGRIWVESTIGVGSSFYFTLSAQGGNHEK